MTSFEAIQGSAIGPATTRSQLQLLCGKLREMFAGSRQLERCTSTLPAAVAEPLERIFSKRLRDCLKERYEQQNELRRNKPAHLKGSQQSDGEGYRSELAQSLRDENGKQEIFAQGNVRQRVNGKPKIATDAIISPGGIERSWVPTERANGLIQSLQEYDQLSLSQVSSQRFRNESVLATHDKPRITNGEGSPVVGLPPQASWPQLTGEEMVKRLQIFTSEVSNAGAPPSSNGTFSTMAQSYGPIQNSFHIEVNMNGRSTDESGQDLSEQIADVLRGQAMQHGIDVT